MEQKESLKPETMVLEILLDRQPPGVRPVVSRRVPLDAKYLGTTIWTRGFQTTTNGAPESYSTLQRNSG
jgi:hypothetical protein